MENNNVILFTFGIVFLALGFISPLVNGEFGQDVTQYDSSQITDNQEEVTGLDSIVTVFSAVFFWVFGLPVWLNIILSMMRVIFWVIIYDKFRGI